MKYTTRFGKTIDISLDRYLLMSDDELSKLEEEQGTSLYPCDPLYISLSSYNDIEIIEIEE
jgi:hypothetical protein